VFLIPDHGIEKSMSELQSHARCHVWYIHGGPAEIVRAHLWPIGAGKLTSDGSQLLEHIITCPVITADCVPLSVTLAWGASVDEQTPFRVPVQLPVQKVYNWTIRTSIGLFVVIQTLFYHLWRHLRIESRTWAVLGI